MTLGKEEKGSAMPADTKTEKKRNENMKITQQLILLEKAAPITTVFGIPNCIPTWDIIGIKISDATVCETKVPIVKQNSKIMTRVSQASSYGNSFQTKLENSIKSTRKLLPTMISLARYFNKFDDAIAFPKTFPPPRSKSVCHDKALKSTYQKC